MTIAVCALCGQIKHGAFTKCEACEQTPSSELDLAYSLALTDHYFPVEALSQISQRFIQTGKRPILPPEQEQVMLEAAREYKRTFAVLFSRSAPAKRRDIRPAVWITTLCILMLGGIALYWPKEMPSETLAKTPTSPTLTAFNTPLHFSQAGPANAPVLVPIITPPTGVLTAAPRDLAAPFSITTSPGYNYYAKLVNQSGSTVMSFFIVGGEPIEAKVPLGKYELRYASGTIWYGPASLFGPDTQYHKADRWFSFVKDARGYRGFTVELIRQRDGNLSTTLISAQEF